MVVLSIIIPAYNVERYLSKCLDSIFCQNVDENLFEVIVVIDGSPDNCLSIAESYKVEHQNIKVINQENKGLSEARNTGVREAKGKYIWFVDSDDWIVDGVLCQIIKRLNKYNYSVFIYKLKEYDESGKETSSVCFPQIQEDFCCQGISALSIARNGLVPLFIISRNFFFDKELFFLSGIYHEDMEFVPRLLIDADKVQFVNRAIYCYLRREGSITSVLNPKRATDYWTIVIKIDNIIHKQNDLQKIHILEEYLVLIFRCFLYEARCNNYDIPLNNIKCKKQFTRCSLLGIKKGRRLKDRLKFFAVYFMPSLYKKVNW